MKVWTAPMEVVRFESLADRKFHHVSRERMMTGHYVIPVYTGIYINKLIT